MSNILSKNKIQALAVLKKVYKGLDCALNFSNLFQLLIAVSLSAQTTDLAVNKVTPELFKKFGTPQKLSTAKISEVEKILSSIGMYKTKSKNIINLSKKLISDFNAQVPDNLDDLISLNGVGRKTANVVLAIGFKVQALPIDTHVLRVSNRIGFSHEKTPEKMEQDLMKKIPKKDWNNYHNALIWHGRKVCDARKPKCETCMIKNYCEKNLT